MSQEIEAGIQELCKRAEAAAKAHNMVATFEVERGIKNARIVKVDQSSRAAYCFVDLSTGNILKPAGYKGPAKGVRGNVLELDRLALDPFGGCFYR